MDAISMLALMKAAKGGGGVEPEPPVLTITMSDTLNSDVNTAIQNCIGSILMGGGTDEVDTSVSLASADAQKIKQGVDAMYDTNYMVAFFVLATIFIPSAYARAINSYAHVVFSLPVYNVDVGGNTYYFSINMLVSNQANVIIHVHKLV